MKKTYIRPQLDVVNIEISHGILAGSENVNISKTPVDHFDTNRRSYGHNSIWD